MRALYRASRPVVPVLTMLGTEELIVDPVAIRAMHRDWPTGQLEMVKGARHELMMEVPPIRSHFLEEMISFFSDR